MKPDFAVIKSNQNFSATFTTSISGEVTMSYGDLASQQSNSPTNTYSDLPPYLLNIKDIDNSTVESISISGNTLTACSVERYKNLTDLNVSNNLLPKSEISKMLVDLDNSGQEDGTLTSSGNLSGGNFPTKATAPFHSLISKGWNIEGTLWTPSDITTTLWYDASDTDTITVEDGTVTQFDDKSNNINELNLTQGTSTRQPKISTLNGLPVLEFDQTFDQSLRHNSGWDDIGDADGSLSIFIVGKHTAGSGNPSFVNFQDDIYTPAGFFSPFGKRGTASGSQSFTTPSGNFLYNGNMRWDASAILPDSYFNLFINGTQEGINKMYDSAFPSTQGEQLSIMSHNNKDFTASGFFAETIITGTIDEPTRQKIEGYLAHKWGLTANLPIAHPYKTYAP